MDNSITRHYISRKTPVIVNRPHNVTLQSPNIAAFHGSSALDYADPPGPGRYYDKSSDQKTVKKKATKTLQLRSKIEPHDLSIKLSQVDKWLRDGKEVAVILENIDNKSTKVREK